MTSKTIAKILMWLALVLLIMLFLLTMSIKAFEPPKSDLWYYTDNRLLFSVPDKAQHYYGSQILVETGIHPGLVLLSGITYEIYQESTGVGFSYRDLIANGLGVLAGALKSQQLVFILDYSVSDKTIILNAVVSF